MSSPQKRFAAREAILADASLSIPARLLYQILDNMAGPKGEAFPQQRTLARMMGFCESNGDRQVRRLLGQLHESGYVSTRRAGRAPAVYVLVWASERTQMSGQKALSGHSTQLRADMDVRSSVPPPYMNPSKSLTPRSTRCGRCGEYHDGDEAVRCGCGAVHHPESVPTVDPLEATRAMLEGYAEQCGLSWDRPDDAICERTLEAAGSVRALMGRLRHLLHDRKLKPSKSWGWFPTVVGSQRRAG